jgi:hypothetical protein
MPLVTIGKYSGYNIEEPQRFKLLKSSEDKDQSLLVFVAFIKIAGVGYIEVEGPTEDGSGWILCGYGTDEAPTIAQLNEIKDNCNSRILVNVFWDPNRRSQDSYQGYHFTGAIVATIQKHLVIEPPSSLSRRLIRDQDYRPDVGKERQEKLLKSKKAGLPLAKKNKQPLKKREIDAMIENRGFFTKILDSIAGVTPDDLRKTLSNDQDHSSESEEDQSNYSEDDHQDSRRSHHHHHHQHGSSSASSASSSRLRTLPSRFD